MGFDELVAAAQVDAVSRTWADVAAQAALARQAHIAVVTPDPLSRSPGWESGKTTPARGMGASARGW